MRISRERVYAQVAEVFALRGTCGRLQVGCVIVNQGRIICTGYNGTLKSDRVNTLDALSGQICNCDKDKPCEKAIHAEANAISFAAKNGISLDGSSIYITHSPCIKCAELMIQSGIKQVYYGQEFRDTKGIDLLIENRIFVGPYAKQ